MRISAKLEVRPLSTIVDVSITNYGIDSCRFHNPIDESSNLNYEFFTITSILGEKIKYTGATILSRTDIIEVEPTRIFSFSIDITNEYMVVAPIIHNVEYTVTCIEKGVLTSNKTIISADAILKEQVLHKVVIPSREEQVEGYSIDMAGVFYKGYKFIGTNNQTLMEDSIMSVMQLAKTLSTISNLYIDKKLIDYHHKFICNPKDGEVYYDYVNDIYAKSLDYIQSGFEISFNGTKCKKGVFAYVYSASPIKIIYLCNVYINAQSLPSAVNHYDTKLGTILHEITHKVSKGEIQDFTYGPTSCFNNVKDKSCEDTLKCFINENGIFTPGSSCSVSGHKPNTNVYNADCLEYLAESVYYDYYVHNLPTTSNIAGGSADGHEEL